MWKLGVSMYMLIKIVRHITLLIVISIGTSCVIENNSLKYFPFKEFNNKYEILDLVEQIEALPIEETSNSLLPLIWKLNEYESKYFVWSLHHSDILCVDSTGKFLFRISSGDGPNTWNGITNYYLDDKVGKIYIADNSKGIFVYDINDRKIEKLISHQDFYPFAVGSDGEYLYVVTNNFDQKGFVWVFDLKNYALNSKFISSPLYTNLLLSINPFSKFNGSLKLNLSYNETIFECKNGIVNEMMILGSASNRLSIYSNQVINSLHQKAQESHRFFYHLPEIVEKVIPEGKCVDTDRYLFSLVNTNGDLNLFILDKNTGDYGYVTRSAFINGKELLYSFYNMTILNYKDGNYYFNLLLKNNAQTLLNTYLKRNPQKLEKFQNFKLIVDSLSKTGFENPIIVKCKMNFAKLFESE